MNSKLIFASIMVIFIVSASAAATAATCADLPDPERYSYSYIVSAIENGIMDCSGENFRPYEAITRAEANEYIWRAIGIMMEDTSDSSPLSREAAFSMLARAIIAEDGCAEDLSVFPDAEEVSEDAVATVGTLVKWGYIKGSGGLLMPLDYMPREQFATMLGRIFEEGNMTVRESGTEMKNTVITGDLYISGSVGDGDITLDHVEISGRLVIRGGGKNSIHIINDSKAGHIIAARHDGAVRVILENSVTDIFSVLSEDVIINLGKNSKIAKLLVNGVNAYVDGEGAIETAFINKNGANLGIKPSTLVLADNVNSFSLQTATGMEEGDKPQDNETPWEPSPQEVASTPNNPSDSDESADPTPDNENNLDNTTEEDGQLDSDSSDEQDDPNEGNPPPPPEVPEEDPYEVFENTSAGDLPMSYQDKEFILKDGGKIDFVKATGEIAYALNVELTNGNYVLTGNAICLTLSGEASLLNNSGHLIIVDIDAQLAPGETYPLPAGDTPNPPAGDTDDDDDPEDGTTEPPAGGDDNFDDEPADDDGIITSPNGEFQYMLLEGGHIDFDGGFDDGKIDSAHDVMLIKGDYIYMGTDIHVDIQIEDGATLMNGSGHPIFVNGNPFISGAVIDASSIT